MRTILAFFAASIVACPATAQSTSGQAAPPPAGSGGAEPQAAPLPGTGGTPAPTVAGGGAELARQLSNPIANLISVPFQNNIDCCYGPENGVRYTLNIQPVIPVSLNRDWNVIVRTIMPLVYQEETVAGGGDAGGLGDIFQSFFFSPKQSRGGFTWGAGPAILYRTGASGIGSGKWGLGPTVVMLKQVPGGITFGILANHVWSVAGGDDRPDISNTFLQPFFAKTWPDSTTLTLNSESTYDWLREQWTVPVNVTLSHIVRAGSQPIQIAGTGRYYLASPESGPQWGLRLTFTLLFPR